MARGSIKDVVICGAFQGYGHHLPSLYHLPGESVICLIIPLHVAVVTVLMDLMGSELTGYFTGIFVISTGNGQVSKRGCL